MTGDPFDPARVQEVATVLPVHVDQLIDAGYQPEQVMSPEGAAAWRVKNDARVAEMEQWRSQARAAKLAGEAVCVAAGGHQHVVRFFETLDEDDDTIVQATVLCSVCAHDPGVDDVLIRLDLPVVVVDGAVQPR